MPDPEVTRDAGGAQSLTLLHGWGVNAGVFDSLVSRLSGQYEVRAMDLPGYGSNPWLESHSFADQAAKLNDGIPGGSLLGWSLGGLYALEIIKQNPDKFDRLILVCSNPCFVTRVDWLCAVDAAVFDAFSVDLQHGWSATIKRFLSLQMMGVDGARELVRSLVMQMRTGGEPDERALKFGLKILKSMDFRPLLADTHIPVTFILGNKDRLVPFAINKEISEVNPRIRVESLAGAAHAPFLSHPDQFISLV